ncbi:hypothetical protein [Herbaspirillum sp. alder98]|uniref:hypothetical protein n=1 Tax=Herbaspirillum sp. alder98 TaxID=2913096 RepID=UPI001CD8D37F|nr:hypothetical protein [Herbaspirillum sp. alder98]
MPETGICSPLPPQKKAGIHGCRQKTTLKDVTAKLVLPSLQLRVVADVHQA